MRNGKRRREEEEKEEGLDGWGACPFTLIADASAVSDGEEINMSLTICTPIHLPHQHDARVCGCNRRRRRPPLPPFFFLHCRVQSLETPTLSPWPLPDASVLSGTSDEDFLE